MRFYWLRHVPNPRYSGWYTYGHKWGLPGVHCPACNATWAATGDAYPSVDLSYLPAQEQKKYLPRVEEDYSEFERLREQVRPLVPPGVHLWPGTEFGPMNGSAQGEFGPLVVVNPWELLMRPEPLERLQAEGLRGLKGCRTQLDLFRLADFKTMIIGNERFVEAVRRLGYEEDIAFRELPVRGA